MQAKYDSKQVKDFAPKFINAKSLLYQCPCMMMGDEKNACGHFWCVDCSREKQDEHEELQKLEHNRHNKITKTASNGTRKKPNVGVSSTRGRHVNLSITDILKTTSQKEQNIKYCPGKNKEHAFQHIRVSQNLYTYLTIQCQGKQDDYPTHCGNCKCPVYTGTLEKWKNHLAAKGLDLCGNQLPSSPPHFMD